MGEQRYGEPAALFNGLSARASVGLRMGETAARARSIVAREDGIRCVTATRIATKALRDGQRVTVDGTKGTVTIER